RQVVDRTVGGIAWIVVGPAPFDPGLVLLSHDQAQVQQLFVQVVPPARRSEGGVIHLGREEGARGHGPRLPRLDSCEKTKTVARGGWSGVFRPRGNVVPAKQTRYFNTNHK